MAGPREPATTPPTVAEIAAWTRRLRRLSDAGADADPDEVLAFLADKDALLAAIDAVNQDRDSVAPGQLPASVDTPDP